MAKKKKTFNPAPSTDRLVIECSCHTHALDVVNDTELLDEGSEPLFYITVWSQSPFVLSWKEKLKVVWKLITNKPLDGGDVVLNQEDVSILTKFLTQKMNENERKLKRRRTNV